MLKFELYMLSSSGVIAAQKYIEHIMNAGKVPSGVQMSHFLILYPTRLQDKIMHILIIFNSQAIKFGRLVPG